MTSDHAARAAGTPRTERPPLARPRACVVGGVSVALADHLGWPVAAVRWVLVGTSLLSGFGILFYLWLWALTPLRPAAPDDPEERVTRLINLPWVFAAGGAAAGISSIVLVAVGSVGPGIGALVTAIVLVVAAVA